MDCSVLDVATWGVTAVMVFKVRGARLPRRVPKSSEM